MMDRYDKDEVKTTARGQWKSILVSVGGVGFDLLDGNHHPCPKCGGNDRFRMLDESAGGLFCNQCFSTKNGDGIAAIMWLLDCKFPAANEKIGQFLGLKPTKKKKASKDPAAKLEFVDWNDLLASMWCLKKKPITVDALKKIGARMAMYRSQFKVIAIPVWSRTPENVVGWNIYNITGGMLTKFVPKSAGKFETKQVKVKLTFGSSPGVMGFIDPDSDVIYKTEGPTDLLALISLCHKSCSNATNRVASVICNSNGAKQDPARAFGWLPGIIDGKEIRVIHDADEPGQEGATMVGDRPGWAPWFAATCENSTVKNLQLPYDIQTTHGKDIRDWIADGGSLDELETMADVDPVQPAGDSSIDDIWEADDDPHRLARVNLNQYKSKHGGKLVFWRSEWWKYKQGRYQKIQSDELKAKVAIVIRREYEKIWKEKLDPDRPVGKVTRGLVANVIGAMESMVSLSATISMPCWLPTRKRRDYLTFRNGILDMDAVFEGKDLDDCLSSHSPDWFSAFRLDYDFDPDADCPKWRKYLDDVMEKDDDRIALLQEWAGYLLTHQNDHQKFLVLEGEGKNGKTVFFAAMTAMLGEDNVSHVAMENFGGRFDLGSTLGKAANISGDVGEIDQLAEGILKQFTGGDTMQFDRKGIQPIQARPTAKLMCAWNTRPRIKDRSEGLWRRILLIPFRCQIEESKRVFGMDQPEWWVKSGESPGILMWAIAGLDRLRENNRFTKCQASADVVAEYRLDTNPAAEFFEEYIEVKSDSSIESKRLYDLYRHWCSETNCRPLGNRQFGKELRRRFPLAERVRVKKDSKLFWHYSKISFNVSEIFGKEVSDAVLF